MWLVLLFCTGCLALPTWKKVNISGLFEDYGCEYTTNSPRLGYRIQTTLSQCQDACLNGGNLTNGTYVGCNAIEHHTTTGWCNLYQQLCNSSLTPAQGAALSNERPRPWYRYYGDGNNHYPVTCVLPHSDPGAVKCIPYASTCKAFFNFTLPSVNDYYKPTIDYTDTGFIINCNGFPDSRFSNSLINPCNVLGCALVSPSSPGYAAYQYFTDAPTQTPTTRTPTQAPTTSAPTENGTTLAPTTLVPTSVPTTLTPTYSPTLPPTNFPTTNYCVLNLTGSLFKLKNCSNTLLRNSTCQLICESQSNRTDLFVNCSPSGTLSWPSPCVLTEVEVLQGSPISLSFGLDFTFLSCQLNKSDVTDVALVKEAFASNIALQLGLPNSSSVNLTATTASDGFVDFRLVLRDRPPNITATRDANLILSLLADKAQRDNLLLFSFARNGTKCQVQGSLIRFSIDFASLVRLLFDLLANLPGYGVALLLVALVAMLVWIPWSSRKSPHPFALLLLLTSIFSFANRAYFLSFVADLSTRAAHLEPSLAPLSDIYVATAAFLGLSVGLNVLLTTVLFIGLRNSSKFQRRWFELHPGSAVCGLLVCIFNPGNILILRSKLCNAESLNAPFPLEHLRRLEWIGVVCALVGELPPLVLTSLTMSLVQGSSRFNWNQTKLNLLLPLVFSSVGIAAAVAMRCCKIRRYTATLRESQPSTTASVRDLARLD